MKTILKTNITVKDICAGFVYNELEGKGLFGLSGKLTPREAARLQGYPETFKIPVSDTSAYKQFGNSVAVPVIIALAKEIKKALDSFNKI